MTVYYSSVSKFVTELADKGIDTTISVTTSPMGGVRVAVKCVNAETTECVERHIEWLDITDKDVFGVAFDDIIERLGASLRTQEKAERLVKRMREQ